jgi:hypothetical protein
VFAWRLAVIALFLAVLGCPALACPICFTGRVASIGQKLDAADAAVLAQQVSPNGTYKVVEVIKGGADSIPAIITEVTLRTDAPPSSSDAPQLLLRNRLSGGWTSLGAISLRHTGWLRELAAMEPLGEPMARLVEPRGLMGSDESWIKRLRLVAPYLESSDPLAAEIAYGEVARAPYRDLRLLKNELTAATIVRWLADPRLAARRAAYTLLLGIAGTQAASAVIEKSLEAAHRSHDASSLSALLAAALELRGTALIPWIEQNYLLDRKRTLPEIEATLLALSVQGSADAAVPRGDIIAVYLRFIDQRKPMVGFVVADLITWQFWGATGKFVEVLKSDALKDPASRLAVINYLRQSPIPIASAELEKLSGLPP